MDDWKTRYWGHNYDRLLAIKQKYDPSQVFYCYHCVGSDSHNSDGRSGLTSLQIGLISTGCGVLVIGVTVFICIKKKRKNL